MHHSCDTDHNGGRTTHLAEKKTEPIFI